MSKLDDTSRLEYPEAMEDATDVLPPTRRSRHSHRAILKAATEIAGRRGYSNATIEAIAAEAGGGKQTIYRWWPNKAVLFIEVYGRLMPPELIAEDTGLAGDLEALLARLSRLYVDSPAGNILSGLIAEAQTDPALATQLLNGFVSPRRTIIRSIFARVVNRGDIRPPDDPDFASDLFSGAVWFQLLLGERLLDRAFVRRVAALIGGVTRSTLRT